MKKDLQFKLLQLLLIIGIWMFIGFLMSLYDYLVLVSNWSSGPSPEYTFGLSVVRNVGAGFIGGLLGGSFMIFYINVKYHDKPYGYIILSVSVSFVLIVAFISLVMAVIMVPIQTGRPLSDPASKAAMMKFLLDPAPLKAGLAWFFIVASTQLLLQVSQKFGRGTFWNLILGKYQTPKEEKRIFMFLDINSSTALAERLGNVAYHLLLKEFFADITTPILENNGSIYQYVGDEVVVAWNYRNGTENNNCVKCFFDIRKTIDDKKGSYMSRFGVVPEFKAAIHCGNVVAGEIGIIKRDITFSGDVLNTTSRIQSMCKVFEAELIVSNDVAETLTLLNQYVLKPLGQIKLRGKEKELLLSSIEPVLN